VALDASVGGASSNSYMTLGAAETYFLSRLHADAWDAADGDDDKASALIMATARLDAEPYYGCRVTSTQALVWPRYGATDRNGDLLSSTTIPQLLQDATCELALTILQDPDWLTGGGDLSGFANLRLGSLDVTPRVATVQTLPVHILRLIAPLRVGGFMGRVVRA